jgi:hypothetical protein
MIAHESKGVEKQGTGVAMKGRNVLKEELWNRRREIRACETQKIAGTACSIALRHFLLAIEPSSFNYDLDTAYLVAEGQRNGYNEEETT